MQHLIQLERTRDCKNEVSIELTECQEEPVKELDYRNDTDRKTKISQNSGYLCRPFEEIKMKTIKRKKEIFILYQK